MPKTSTPGGKAILQKDKEYRKAQNARARANRERRASREAILRENDQAAAELAELVDVDETS